PALKDEAKTARLADPGDMPHVVVPHPTMHKIVQIRVRSAPPWCRDVGSMPRLWESRPSRLGFSLRLAFFIHHPNREVPHERFSLVAQEPVCLLGLARA